MKLKIYPDERPKTRGECADMPRPCPFVSCRYHLAHDWINPFHGKGPSDDEAAERISTAAETCVLDVAEDGGHTTREIAEVTGKTHQAICSTLSRIADRDVVDADAMRELSDSIAGRGREQFDHYAPGEIISETYFRDKREK